MGNKLIIASLLLVFIIPLAGCKSRNAAAGGDNLPQNQSDDNEPAVLSASQQESQYAVAVKEILASYWQTQDATGIRDKILTLRAPAKYLDLHLDLVLTLESIEQGEKISDQSKINSGAEKLKQLAAQYPWLQ